MEKTLRLADKMKYKEDHFGVKGHVIIKDSNGKIFVDKDNHIVTTGRQWLMTRMFNKPYDETSTSYNWVPGWFAVGSGGAATDTPFSPIWPTDEDTDLYNKLAFTQTGESYSSDTYHKLVDSITYSSSLTTKLTMTLDYLDFADSYINEAGLYISESQVNTTATDFIMFSHVTFPTFPKSQYQKIYIEWYFLF